MKKNYTLKTRTLFTLFSMTMVLLSCQEVGEGRRTLASLKNLSNSEIVRIENPNDLLKTKVILKDAAGERAIELKDYPEAIRAAAFALFVQKEKLQEQVKALKGEVDLSGSSYRDLTQAQLQSIAVRNESIKKLKKDNDKATLDFKKTFEEYIKALNNQSNASNIEIQLDGLGIRKEADGSPYNGKKSLEQIQEDVKSGVITNKDMLTILGSEKERLGKLATTYDKLTENHDKLIGDVERFLKRIGGDLLGFTNALTETNKKLGEHNQKMKDQGAKAKEDLEKAERELKGLGMNDTEIKAIKDGSILPSNN